MTRPAGQQRRDVTGPEPVKLEHIVLELSTAFARASSDDVGPKLSRALAQVGRYARADAATVLLFDDTGEPLHEQWTASSEEPPARPPAGVDWRGPIGAGATATATGEDGTAWLLSPLTAGGEVLGAICLALPAGSDESSGDSPVWPLLRVAGEIIGGALLRHRSDARLAHLALHDSLTGLPNRTLLEDRLRHAVCRHQPNHQLLAVLAVNLDRFGLVNDSIGHQAGDGVLQEAATRIESCTRPGDTVARVAGGRFVVLTEQLALSDEAVAVAERIRLALAAPLPLAGGDLIVTASIGVALGGTHTTEPATLLREAEVALDRAKELGRNRVEVFDEATRNRALHRFDMERNLRLALENDELRILFQPLVDAGTGQVFGAEALLRWEHPQLGTVSPSEFIGLAEETGLIIPIGRWVIREACLAIADLVSNGTPLEASVNLSARQLHDEQLVPTVRAALADSGLEPERLCLEITESALMVDTERGIEVLTSLRALGIRLAIDDFGTGYSSLGYLRSLPVDTIKIDRAFVSAIPESVSDIEIIRSVIQLGHGLGLRVLAEGVETPEQLDVLSEAGCDQWQGFLCSRPTSVAAVTEIANDRLLSPQPAAASCEASVPDGAPALAASIGGRDLFVFRRVSAERFVHVGGAGRGEGWAGIVEIGLGEEPQALRDAIEQDRPLRLRFAAAERIFGPYFARDAVIIPMPPDVLVVVGHPTEEMEVAGETQLRALAHRALTLIDRVSPAKRLADELELLTAIQQVLSCEAGSVDAALQHIVDCAAEALSCELGFIYLADEGRLAVARRGFDLSASEAELRSAMIEVLSSRTLPACRQDIGLDPLPEPLTRDAGVRSYYLLPLGPKHQGILVLLHTDVTPRGFTLLCQQLGLRLSEAAGMLLESARSRESLSGEIDRVAYQARLDPLTAVSNRRAWDEALASVPAEQTASVIIVDLDGLKATNDRLGHHAGDELLLATAKVLRGAVRDRDLVARLGGDEFGILLPGTGDAACQEVAARIKAAAAETTVSGGGELSVSVGHATRAVHEPLPLAQRRADAAMYVDKLSRRTPA